MWKEIVGWIDIALIVGTGIYTIYAEVSSHLNRYRTEDSLATSSPVRPNPFSTPIPMLSPTPFSRKETGKVANISTTPAPTSRSVVETSPATPSQTRRDIPRSSGLIQSERVLNIDPDGMVIEITQHQRPPFYEGSMPLVYKSKKQEFGSSLSSSRITLWNDFGDFRNTFFASNGRNIPGVGFTIPSNARTTDSRGRVVAEARVVNLIKGEGIEIEEYHFGNGRSVQFKCKSLIGFHGYKLEETGTVGTKMKDYYFVWPM